MSRSYAETSSQKGDSQRRDLRGPRHGKSGHNFDMRPESATIVENRTRYPHTRTVGDPAPLKSGHNNTKIGKMVTKGRWSGMPILCLTLEERATCGPCQHKLDCFGNRMNYAKRHVHGPDLEARLIQQLMDLERKYPQGFLVRLHILGDFYSVEYVNFWRQMLDNFVGLRIYGYTARAIDTPIGDELLRLAQSHGDTFAMRWSDANWDKWATVSVARAEDAPKNSTVCPAQIDKVATCGNCALCWQSPKNIAFINH